MLRFLKYPGGCLSGKALGEWNRVPGQPTSLTLARIKNIHLESLRSITDGAGIVARNNYKILTNSADVIQNNHDHSRNAVYVPVDAY
jgi:hypothetical protein